MSPESGPRTTYDALGGRGDRGGRSSQRPKSISLKWFGAVCFSFFVASIGSTSFGEEKDAGTAFKLTLRGLEAVGAFPPPPAWVPYYYPHYAPWWGWGPPGSYPPPQYPAQPYPLPATTSPPTYPPQVKPAGRLLILTNPIDAEVYVDGVRLQQQSNLSYDVGLLAGPHQVDIRKEGFKPFSYKAEIPPGGGMVLPVELEKQ